MGGPDETDRRGKYLTVTRYVFGGWGYLRFAELTATV